MGLRGAGRGCDHRDDRGMHDRDSDDPARNSLPIRCGHCASDCPADPDISSDSSARDSLTDLTATATRSDSDSCRQRRSCGRRERDQPASPTPFRPLPTQMAASELPGPPATRRLLDYVVGELEEMGYGVKRDQFDSRHSGSRAL